VLKKVLFLQHHLFQISMLSFACRKTTMRLEELSERLFCSFRSDLQSKSEIRKTPLLRILRYKIVV